MSTQATPADVAHLSTPELVELFCTLEAPAIREMHGEYRATLLQQPNLPATAAGQLLLGNPLVSWQCKAFRPVDEDSGRGYNTFSLAGKVIQRYPMQTRLAPSRYDGRPAYYLIYRAYHSACGTINMVDEVRRLETGRYLGIGTWGFTDAQRRIALPFLLEGPAADYRGDMGKPRRGFQPGKREIPALK